MSDAQKANEFLAHYGVPGMKWGKRKLAPGYSAQQYRMDRRSKGSGYAKNVNKEVGKGRDVNTARDISRKRDQKIAAVKVGVGVAMIAAPSIINAAMGAKDAGRYVGYSAMNKATQAKGRKAAANIFAQEKGITNYSTVKLAYDQASKTWG